MCEAFGYKVTKLKRIRIMNIHLDNLKVGTYREVTPKEMKELLELIKDSSSETVREVHE
jgi:23S rRNA pseudouridine2604 synthase